MCFLQGKAVISISFESGGHMCFVLFFFKDALGSVMFWDINSITWLQSQKRIVKGKTSQVNNTDLL